MPVIYKPKRLIPGPELNQPAGTLWVAIPDKFGNKVIHVYYNDQRMNVSSWKNEARAFRRFRDKFWEINSNRPKYYTLGYFKWTPEA